MADDFTEIKLRVLERHTDAVRLGWRGGDALVPRESIHGYDDAEIDGAEIGEELPVRIDKQKVRELGW